MSNKIRILSRDYKTLKLYLKSTKKNKNSYKYLLKKRRKKLIRQEGKKEIMREINYWLNNLQ